MSPDYLHMTLSEMAHRVGWLPTLLSVLGGAFVVYHSVLWTAKALWWLWRVSFTGTITGAKCWGILYDPDNGFCIACGRRSWRP